MSSRSLNRKDFLVLSLGSAAASFLAAACSDDPAAPGNTAGTNAGGTGGGAAGTPATGGSAAGTPATGGMGGGGTGAGGSSAGASGTATTGGGGAGGASGGAGGASGGSGGASGGSGGASGGAGGGGGGGMCNADIMVTSSGDSHMHTLKVTAAQIMAGTDVTIETSNASNHTHWVKVTAADFTALKAGMQVKKKSCSGGDHEYVLKCGGGGDAPMAPTCDANDMCGGMMANACN